jgi:hypothetical protein
MNPIFEKPCFREPVDCLTNGRTADAKRLGDRRLNDPLALQELASQNLASEV